MFIHFGMSTFSDPVTPASQPPASTYAPDRLDVDQWVRVARDAGMKYAVLTTKHVAGHCLWPTKHTDYSVANSANRTDVVEAFVQACEKRGVLPGLYYCSEDYHHRFGGRCRDEAGGVPFTTSLYQTFQTAQITELLTQYGPIAEMWIDIPGILGRGYRTFLYHYIGQLQPELLKFVNEHYPELIRRLTDSLKLADEDAEALRSAMSDFKRRRASVPEEGEARAVEAK